MKRVWRSSLLVVAGLLCLAAVDCGLDAHSVRLGNSTDETLTVRFAGSSSEYGLEVELGPNAETGVDLEGCVNPSDVAAYRPDGTLQARPDQELCNGYSWNIGDSGSDVVE